MAYEIYIPTRTRQRPGSRRSVRWGWLRMITCTRCGRKRRNKPKQPCPHCAADKA